MPHNNFTNPVQRPEEELDPSFRYYPSTGTAIGAENKLSVNPHARQVAGNHYKNLAVEPWRAMEAWLTTEEFIGFLRGNVIKYHARANSGKGSRYENVMKAQHYEEKLREVLQELERKETNTPTQST